MPIFQHGVNENNIFLIEGKSYKVDDECYLKDSEKWDENFAIGCALRDGLELTEAHWEIINFQREYFKKFRFSPTIKLLVKDIGTALGHDKGNTKYLYELFNMGPAKQSARYAGSPRPSG